MPEIYQFFPVGALLLLLGIFSSKISSQFNVPVLLMFLGVGMLAGVDGIGKIQFQDHRLANAIGTLAMSFILYSGGLDTNFRSVRSVLWRGGILASLGVFVTALVMGVGACWILKMPLEWGLLLGAVVSSTDAAAVFAILRSKSVSLKGKLQPALELESGSNDPMAAFLTIFMIEMITRGDVSYWMILPLFLLRMSVGIGWGYLVGKLGCLAFNKARFEYEGLYFVMGVALVLAAFGVAELCFGNGFMAVYVCGMTMGHLRFRFKKGLTRFNDGIAWLMQVMMFMVLGLLVNPGELPEVALNGFWMALLLMFLARPAAVFLCTAGSRFSVQERLLISWVGLRGAAPIVLATFPMIAGVEHAQMLFNLVFFIVIASVLIQGRTLMPLAQMLKLDRPLKDKVRSPLELEVTGSMEERMFEFDVLPESPLANRTLADIQLPPGVLVMLLRRNNKFMLARGNTMIRVHDGVLMMGDDVSLRRVSDRFFPGSDYDSEE